jgi:hypothetical protein
VPEAEWDEILVEIEERYGPGITGLRVEEHEIRFENRDDEAAFRLFRTCAIGQGELWRFQERVDQRVVRVGMADDWRTALDRYDHAVRTGHFEA